MVSGPITSWQIERENVEAVTDFLFLSSKITADGDCSHEIRRQFLLGRKAMTNLGKGKSLSRVWLFATPWAIAYQAPPSMEFSSQEYCSGLPFPSPGDLPDPGIEPWSPALQADALLSEPPGKPRQYIKKQKHHFADKVKAMVFPVVKYGCEKWTIKKGEQRRLDVFKLWCWRRLLRIRSTARRSNQLILKEINSEYSLEGLVLKLKLQ